MPADIMNHARAVRREDLFWEAESQGDSLGRHHKGEDGKEDEEAAVARAALDAYMKDTLGLQFDIPPPPPAAPKPAKAASEEIAKVNDNDKKDDDSDESKDSSDDDEENDITQKNGKARRQSAAEKSGATEFAFRLFSGSGKTAATTKDADATEPGATVAAPAPIVLLDDGDGTEALGPGGIVNPPRPLSFYLAGEPTAEAMAQYTQSTLTGEDIIKASNARAWGLEVPWRVRTVLRADSKGAMRALLSNALSPEAAAALPTNLRQAIASATNAVPSWASSQSPEPTPLPLLLQPLSSQPQKDDTTKKHRRPGKRLRILMRKRAQAKRDREARSSAQAQSKEEHLLEKKKRLNRTKKLRRREKKRQAKAEGGEGGDGGDDASENESGDE
ncbi:hypothetical protein SEUCBS139899_008201 [Sporothrix eucalyptigena]|uniref:Uncharacterized protein n=1 Tax=Sporothrix eucalyptigena TaxID=1812306 RepID=A0ABP0BVD5_9PEZI